MNLKVEKKSSFAFITRTFMQLTFFFIFSWASQAFAVELNGKVFGSNQVPKKFVSVSVFGSVNRRTQTNTEGEFSIDLPPGSYTIRIRQDPNRKEFDFEVTDTAQDHGGNDLVPFEVDW